MMTFFTGIIYAEGLKTGDLIFQIAGDSNFSRSISEATSQDDTYDFVHVGIIEVVSDTIVNVIEASPEEGVRIISLGDFIEHVPLVERKPGVVIKRVTQDLEFEKIIKLAYSHLGEDYDWWYMPQNNKMYCSELIYECYLDPSEQHIFELEPMNFRAADGTMPEFWINLFNKLNCPIPEGIPGSNPNSLSRSPFLKTIEIDLSQYMDE